jgi:hypothetical protein
MRVFNIPRNIMTHYNEWRQAGLEARYIADEVVKKRAIKVALAKKVAQAKHAAEQPICLPMFCSQSELISIDRFKETFEFWDEWSGSRFIRRTPPSSWHHLTLQVKIPTNPILTQVRCVVLTQSLAIMTH